MPAPNRSKLARIQIAPSVAGAPGAWATMAYVRSGRLERGTENQTVLRWLGGESVDAGDPTLAATVPVWWTDDDIAGQEIAVAAWASGDSVFLRFCPKGTTAGSKVQQFEAKVTSCPMNFDAEGRAVEGEFGYYGIASTLSTVTLTA